MSKYEEGLQLMQERCGNGKDNLISLSTIAMTPGADGKPRPYARDVDAFYEDGTFYVSTSAKATKMQQIAHNSEVAFTVCGEWVSGNGVGENLGWVMEPKNAELRLKLREAFSAWYDFANNESSEESIILAIRITRATLIKDHGAVKYFMDFVNKLETEEGKIL